MALPTHQVVSLGDVVGDKPVKVCDIDGVKHASITDVVCAVMDCPSATARSYWKRLRDSKPGIRFRRHTFPGQCSASVVADANTMMEIIFELPGQMADRFRAAGAETFLKVLNPDEDFIDELRDRRGRQSENPTSWFCNNERVVQSAIRAFSPETFIYVRVRLPEEYTKNIATVEKRLTTNVIKIGIANVLHDRHVQYGDDDGFFLYAMRCKSRRQAEIVEDIAKYDFRGATCFGSREYMECVSLARTWSSPTPATYKEYLQYAGRMFAHMVNKLKTIWPEDYVQTFGEVFSITEVRDTQTTLTPRGSIAYPRVITLDFPKRELTTEMAAELGIHVDGVHVPPPTATPIIVRDTGMVGESVPVAADPPRTRSHGAVIARDLVTGAEETFASAEEAARLAKMASSCLRTTYLDQPRQVGGRHYRTPGKPHWVPPDNYVICAGYVEKGRPVPVIARSATETRVYESKSAVARVMGLHRRTLHDHMNKDTEYGGFKWSEVLHDDLGRWSEDPADLADGLTMVQPLIEQDPESGKSGRCNGKVIGRDLRTGRDRVFSSASKAAVEVGISTHCLLDQFVNKRRQAKGMVFRTFDAERVWQPPPAFRYSLEKVAKRVEFFVKAIDPETHEVTGIYEGPQATEDVDDFPATTVRQFLDTNKPVGRVRRIWSKASEEDCGTWISTAGSAS